MNLKKLLPKYWLILLFAVVILLRLPSLFEPFTYGDEGIYLTLGQAAKKGLIWYRDIHDNKPPMLYLIAAVAGNFPAYRLINFFWSLITILVFWQLTKLVFPKNQNAEITATAAFAIFTSLHTFEANVGNAENFMLLPTIAGFYLIYEALTVNPSSKKSFANLRNVFGLVGANWVWLLAGLLFGIAALFKVPAAFDFAAVIVLIFLVFLGRKEKNYSLYIFCNSLILIGFLLPIVASFVYYAYHHAFSQYLSAAFMQNLPYLSSWSAGQHQAGGLPSALIIRSLLVTALIGWLFYRRSKIFPSLFLTLIWFSFSWFAALLSSRPYPHYLIQLLPPMSLSLGLPFLSKRPTAKKFVLPIALAIIFGVTFWIFRFWSYPNWSYYSNFYQYVLRIKNRQQYFYDFDSQAANLHQAAAHLKERTLPTEKIFIWGTQPSIYALSQRLPVGRFTASYHIVDFNGYQKTMEALEEYSPSYVLVSHDEKRPFPEFFSWLVQNYFPENNFGQITVYHRIFRQ